MLDWITLSRELGERFRDPIFLWGVLLAPLVYALAARAPATLTYSSLQGVDLGPESLRARLTRVPAILLALAAALFAIAMAGPRSGDAATLQRREGIAIAMVVDRSGSMTALDFSDDEQSLSRLQAVKLVFEAFVAGGSKTPGRPDDLMGLIGFASFADGLCPLTFDHANLVSILRDMQPAPPEESGTAVGDGLALAVERLRQNPARSKVAVLLTDGVSNAGEIQPLQAADLAAQYGIKVYTIGAGRTGYAPIPVTLPNGEQRLERRYVEMDESTLEAIAERTGGRYFNAADTKALEAVVAEIDRLERSELAEVRYLQYRPHYAAFAASAALCVAIAALLSGTLLRRLP
jgi:Ca-activated chloride channel homolog